MSGIKRWWENQGRWTVPKKEGGKASVWAPKIKPKHRKSLPNGRQREPQGGGAKRRPLGAAPKAPPCCLPFGKDFLCFGLTSGAHPDAFPPSFFWTVHLPWFSHKGPLGPLGPFKKSLRSGIHARNHPKWSATPFTSCPEPPKMGGEAAHFWTFPGMK